MDWMHNMSMHVALTLVIISIAVEGHGDLQEDFTSRWTIPLLRQRRQADQTPVFRYSYVTQCGHSYVKEPNSIEVKTTLEVSDVALEKTARLVHRLVAFMSPTLFRRVASLLSIGVYNRVSGQTPDIFPEYTASPECQSSCSGNCSLTCSDRGIPMTYELSYGGTLVVVPAENVECASTNPKRFESLLVGEFSKSLLKYALTGPYRDMIDQAHANAPSIWGTGITVENYFRQATLSWFQSTKTNSVITYGMNGCFGGALCPDERFSRNNIKTKDITLYNALKEIYSYGRGYIHGGVTLCDW